MIVVVNIVINIRKSKLILSQALQTYKGRQSIFPKYLKELKQ